MISAPRLLIGCFLLSLIVLACPVAAQFEELAAKVPVPANAIVLLDGEKLLASPLAVKEGWKAKYEQSFASGLVTVAPDTRRMIVATQLDYEHMNPLWQVVVADFSRERTVIEMARRTRGDIDKVNDLDAIVLGDNSIAVQFSPTQLGIMAPANRQSVARWVRDAQTSTTPSLSDYLKGTLTASQTSQVVIAFDLADAVPLSIIRSKVAACETFAGKDVDLERAAQVLASLRGMVLEVAITETSNGRLMIHFSRDASVLAPFAKPLLLEVLGNMGAMIDDIADWKVTTEKQRFTFTGPLSEGGRRRVMSLIDHPTAALIASGDEGSRNQEPGASKEAYATQQYFKSLMKITDELREKGKDAKTFGQHAMWLDNWARRIDRMPILDVDPEMLAFGNYLTARMRDASGSLKGIGIQSAARSAQVYNNYSTSVYGGGYYGYGGGYSYYTQYNNVGGQRRAIRQEEKAAGATSALGIRQEVENETKKIRQAMTQKYKISF